MLATRTARWTAGTALVCLVLLVATWFLLVSPRLANAAEIREQTESARSGNDALELQIAQLKAQFAELPEKKAELAAIYAQMPAAAAMPEMVRTLDAAAAASGVVLREVQPLAATEVAAAVAAATATDAAPATGDASSETTASPETADATATTDPASAGPRIVAIPLSVTVEGDYFETVAFLKRLQTDIPRVFLVDALKVTTSSGSQTAADGEVTLVIGGRIFALPDTAAAGTDAASSTSTAQGTQAPAATEPSSATSAEGTTTS